MTDDIHSLLERIERVGSNPFARVTRALVSDCVPLTRTRDGREELAFCWLVPDLDYSQLPIVPPFFHDPTDEERRTRQIWWKAQPRVVGQTLILHPVVWAIVASACWWGWFCGADPDRSAVWELSLGWRVSPLRLQLALSRLGVDEYHATFSRAFLLLRG